MSKTTFKSSVQWAKQGVRCTAIIRDKQLIIDEPESLGGTDKGPNPIELLLAALGGCLNILVNTFAPEHKVDIEDVIIETEGDLDPDGFTEKDLSVRPGVQEIRYKINIKSTSPQSNILELLEHIDRICPIKDTLSGVPIKKY